MTEQQTITRGLKMLATAEIIAAGMSLVAALDLFSIIELGLAGILVLGFRLGGLASLRRAREEYRRAFLLSLAEIWMSIVASAGMWAALLLQAEWALDLVTVLVGIMSCVMGYLVVHCVCAGTLALLHGRGLEKAEQRGDMARSLFLVVMLMVAVVNVMDLLPLREEVFRFAGTLSNVLTTAAYAFYAWFLLESGAGLRPAQ
ncbi:hypothetical protein [Pseudoflavonifractor sp. HCP28S3_F10]|uniref:hypothetical protein n=1 Tax=Pseudoflavonifractor sp. HCP28S3_F10 TaxID=3438947 RepID=UPI003F8BD2D8